ncbi:MAG TPA: PH domain-containing protein [Candidatus Faecousia excrementipullorum]|nr:PH domain-containing protein [Candidatus Faecousia excrementipullorum]
MEYLWKDRKRHLGLPLSFTRYALSEDRLFLSVGFFSIKDEEILLYRIRDISTSRSLWQRIFGVGTITVVSSDKTAPTLLLKNVKNPLDVKELLHRQVEEVKIRRRIRVGEIMTDVPEDLPEESDAQWHDEDDME